MYTYKPHTSDTLDTMLSNAQLDWRMEKAKVAMRPVGYQHGSDPTDTFEILDDHRALRRADNGQVFAMVSPRYHVHQNRDIVQVLHETAAAVGTRITRLGSLFGGQWVFAQIELGKSAEIGGSSRDRVEGYLTVTTRHGSGATKGGGTAVCIVCENTFQGASRDLQGIISHRSSLENNTDILTGALDSAADSFGYFTERAQQLAKSPVHNPQVLLDWIQRVTDPAAAAKRDQQRSSGGNVQVDRVDIDTLLAAHEDRHTSRELTAEMLNRAGKGILESVVDSPGQDLDHRQGTWWGAYNGLTHYVDHMAQSRSDENRFRSATAGPGSEMKSRGLELAVLASEASDAQRS